MCSQVRLQPRQGEAIYVWTLDFPVVTEITILKVEGEGRWLGSNPSVVKISVRLRKVLIIGTVFSSGPEPSI